MPRPRFNKLEPARREQILEIAARAFALYGYEGASLNQILADAGLSKGAAYYYFDSKADLYAAALRHFTASLLVTLPLLPEEPSAISFWPNIQSSYQQLLSIAYEQSWKFSLLKSAHRLSAAQIAEMGLSDLFGDVQQHIAQLIACGQQLGVIRSDLPESLLIAMFMAVDDTFDRWLLAHQGVYSQEEIVNIHALLLEGLERLLQVQGQRSGFRV